MNYTERHIIESYSAMLNGLSSNSKREIIENLSKSLETRNDILDTDFYNAFGAFCSEKNSRRNCIGHPVR
jgi:hypothetical protein